MYLQHHNFHFVVSWTFERLTFEILSCVCACVCVCVCVNLLWQESFEWIWTASLYCQREENRLLV